MKIAYITFGHIDSALPLVKYISKEAEVDLYFVFAKNFKKESIINFEDIDVVTGFVTEEKMKEILDSETREYIGESFKFSILIYSNLKFQSLSNILLSYQLSKILRKKKYDCIHFNGNNLQQVWISTFTPFIPKVHTIHDYIGHYGERSTWAERYNKFLMISKKQKIMHFRIPSGSDKSVKETLHTIYYGPLEIFKIWGREKVLEEENTVLFFGRISPYKGIEYLVQAVPIIKKSVPNLKVIIAGNGKFYFDITHIRDDDTYEIINRYIPNNELVKLIQRASLIICPFIDTTQSGMVMTAYAFNKPVVASAVGGIPEVVEHNVTGKLVPSRDPQALAEATIDLLLHDNKIKDMKKNIQKKCFKGELSWDYIAKQTIDVYRKAAKKS
jgi:glycosyltransferase involved in cell wall biosynthesis